MIAVLLLGLAGPAGPAAAQVLAQEYERGQDPDLVAPGMSAFLAFFALALVLVLLGWSLTRQVRRSEYRNAQRRQAQAAAADEPAPAKEQNDAHQRDDDASDAGGSDAGASDHGASSGADKPPPEQP